ncbi:MAG: hypothetical protein WB870_04935 [Gallionellaceae bacterium]
MDWIQLLLLMVLCYFAYSVTKTMNVICGILEARNAATDITLLLDLSRRQCELIERLDAKVHNIETDLASFGSSTPFYKKPALKVDAEELTAIGLTLSEIASSVGRVEDIANQLAITKS